MYILGTDTYNYNVFIIWMCITCLLTVILHSLSIKNELCSTRPLLCSEHFDSLNAVYNVVVVNETDRLFKVMAYGASYDYTTAETTNKNT